jgi:exosome complex component RRP45
VGETVTVHDLDERKPVPIAIHFIPLCVSFGLLGHGLVLLDPNGQEEKVALGTTTIMLNSHREVCGVQKHGRPGISPDQLLACITNATQIYQSTIDRMNKAVAEAELACNESDLRKALAQSQQTASALAASSSTEQADKMEM